MERIAILIPTFNRPKFLKECILSIYNQTTDHYKIYIVDDFSGDDTKEMIDKINNGLIVYYKNDENKGVSYSRNMLLSLCGEKIACWQDDDDIMNCNRLINQYKAIAENPNSYAIGNSRIFRNINQINRNENTECDKVETAFASMMFWTKDMPHFNIQMTAGEDTEWMKRIQLKRIELKSINYYVRYHDNRLGKYKKGAR